MGSVDCDYRSNKETATLRAIQRSLSCMSYFSQTNLRLIEQRRILGCDVNTKITNAVRYCIIQASEIFL